MFPEIAEIINEITNGQGYVLLPNLITTQEAIGARQFILDLAEQRRKGALVAQENRERLYGLIYQSDIFAQMAQHETLLSIIEALIGEDVILGGFSAHILHPGAKSMGVHVDYPYWAMTAPFPKQPILELQVIWLMEDFTADNGAPLFAPGTQNLATKPDLSQFDSNAIKIMGKAGSAVISHGLCWHSTSENNSDRPRVSLLGNYTPQYIHPLENNLFSYQPEAIENAPPRLKKLLRHTLMPKSQPIYGMKFMQ
jgi:ectoine hydroxylase-related dioxygenase (phytanoyl-CoA dioxygenase family)